MQGECEGETEKAGKNEKAETLEIFTKRKKYRKHRSTVCVCVCVVRVGGGMPICGLWVKAGLQVCEALISLQDCI